MPQIAQLIGGAGTGKTTELLNLMDKCVDQLHDPHLVGFASFTRAACKEAAMRACARFGMVPTDLIRDGWFRTIHSIAHKTLGVGDELLTDNRASREWITEALQESVTGGTAETPNAADPFSRDDTDADKALALWAAARNRMEPFAATWTAEDEIMPMPALDYCEDIIGRYEAAKRVEHRVDFVDLLSLFAGVTHHVDGVDRVDPAGECPQLPVWILDECQDASPLLHECQLRLINQPECRWAYAAGDPFQSIYGFAGASPACFLDGFPVAKRRIMPKSYRCPRAILELGENLLIEASDYFDRGIAPADGEGEVEDGWIERGLDFVRPDESWLILARTNFLAARLGRALDKAGVPWLSTKGGSGWNAPVRHAAINALFSLERGGPVDGGEWQSILKNVPSAADGVQLLERGTKSRFQELDGTAADLHPFCLDPTELGATPEFVRLVRAGAWRQWVEGVDDYLGAVEQWGMDAVASPQVRVGTIHSAKGAEADNVVVFTTITGPCYKAAQTQAGFDEEARCKYVAVTRAKKRLVLLRERVTRFRWRM